VGGPERASLELREKLFMPAEQAGKGGRAGKVRFKRNQVGQLDIAIVGTGKNATEYRRGELPDGIAAEAMAKHPEHRQTIEFFARSRETNELGPRSTKERKRILEKEDAEWKAQKRGFEKDRKKVEAFLKKAGKSLDELELNVNYDTRQHGQGWDGLVYRGDAQSQKPWIKDLDVYLDESSNISKSQYPIMRMTLENGATIYQQIRISDHPQVSRNAPKEYEFDYRSNSLKDALPKIEEDMEAMIWQLWGEQKEWINPD